MEHFVALADKEELRLEESISAWLVFRPNPFYICELLIEVEQTRHFKEVAKQIACKW